ncbi:MAG: hypothetical protein FWD44_06065 [Oscillospiraceae bacterium]|nr:hypothetical protein [Oscillospiraceae bacterium]
MSSQIKYNQKFLDAINREIRTLIEDGYVPEDIGIAMNPIECKIVKPTLHGFQMLKERGINFIDVQHYVDNAVIMFEQEGDQDDILHLYLSFDGGCVLINASGKLITAYSKDNFKPHVIEILKVVKRYEK